MARRKSSRRTTALPQAFSHSPFESLKGLSASVVSPQPGSPVEAPAIDRSPSARLDEPCCFADAMDSLGVEPLPDRAIARTRPADGKAETAATSPSGQTRQEREAEVFLAAIGAMTVTFRDEWPEEVPVKQAAAQRMKQVERGRLTPEDELDLHGLTVDEALGKVRFFLQNARFRGCLVVLIITGRGVHSAERPVLRDAVTALLEQSREQVLEWGLAPRRYGGDGALVVFLKGVRKE